MCNSNYLSARSRVKSLCAELDKLGLFAHLTAKELNPYTNIEKLDSAQCDLEEASTLLRAAICKLREVYFIDSLK